MLLFRHVPPSPGSPCSDWARDSDSFPILNCCCFFRPDPNRPQIAPVIFRYPPHAPPRPPPPPPNKRPSSNHPTHALAAFAKCSHLMSGPSRVDHGPSSPPLSPTLAKDQAPCSSAPLRPPTEPTAPSTAEHKEPSASIMSPTDAPRGGVVDDATTRSVPATPTAAATPTSSTSTPASRGTPAPTPLALDPSMPAQSQSAPPAVPQGPLLPSDVSLPQPDSGADASADPLSSPTKRSRPPAFDQRQPGSSLLTQALATARGIPPQASAHPSTASSSTTSSTYTGPQTTAAGTTSSVLPGNRSRLPYHTANHTTAPHREDTDILQSAPLDFKNDGSLAEDGAGRSLTPRAAATPIMAASVSPAVPATFLAPESDGLSSSHTMSTSGVTDLAMGQNTTPPSDRVPEANPFGRIEREIRALGRQRLSRTYSQSSDVDTSSVFGSPEKILLPTPQAQDFLDDEQQRTRPGTIRPEPRYSIGPEKMWSIGSGELDDAQDGHVEKSVAKAMARAEPNNRSRKATHTLGFFREGLPEEKTNRKGTKGGSQARVASGAEQSGRTGAGIDSLLEEPAGFFEPQQLPVHSPRKESTLVPSRRPTPPPDTPAQAGDLMSTAPVGPLEEELTPAALQPPSPAPSGTESPARTVVDESSTNSSGSVSSPGARSHQESGDESGEEKISSAFFLPHQDPERGLDGDRGSSDERPSTPGHPQLRGKDQLRWLVKAGEPEPEDHTPPPTPPASQSGRSAQHPSVSASLDTTMVCEEIAIDEPEKVLPSSEKAVSHPTLLYHDNYRTQEYGDQKDASQPLEAIELIPYNHQVGGHTPLWRFSKRAVCKKLNNRENEFYETVEHFHRDLLSFLPRYVTMLALTVSSRVKERSQLRMPQFSSEYSSTNLHLGILAC